MVKALMRLLWMRMWEGQFCDPETPLPQVHQHSLKKLPVSLSLSLFFKLLPILKLDKSTLYWKKGLTQD